MKMVKKFIAVLLAALLIFITPLTAFAASKPAKPTVLTPSSTAATVTVKWKKVSGATGYAVYSYNSSSKKYTKLGTTKNTSYVASRLTAGKTYYYAVKSYKTSKGKTYFSAYSSKITVSTLPLAPKSLKYSARGTSGTSSFVTMGWGKVSGATGYKLQYSTSKTFKSSVKSVTSTATTKKISSLKAGTTYYFRAYAYRTVNKKTYTSAATTVVAVKTPAAYSDTVSKVDESTTYQTIDGFGASGAWWAQRIGRWSEQGLTPLDEGETVWTREQTEAVLKYLYDKNDGIGLNIYRYNIGTDSYLDDGITNKWERTEGFIESIDSNGTIKYDFTKDASAQNTLSVIKALAGDDLKLTLFANSPPTQLTDNGKAYCSYNEDQDLVSKRYSNKLFEKKLFYNGVNTNLSSDKYGLYAQFLCDVADYFTEQGYNVRDVSPVNEPQYEWSCDSEGKTSQEGSHYTPAGVAELMAYCALAGKDKPYEFSAFESAAADGSNDSLYIYANTIFNTSKNQKISYNGTEYVVSNVNKKYYNTITAHSYWADKSKKQETKGYIDTDFPGLKIACTEYCQMTNDTSTGVYDISNPIPWWDPARNGLEIEYGVQLARTMLEDFTVLNATEWNWWTACSGGYYPDGLVYVDYKNPDNIQTSKRLWAMGNFSKFIQSGAKRVKVTEAQKDLLSVAFKNPDGSLAIVYVNQTSKNKKVNISAAGYKNYSAYVTSANSDLKLAQSGTFALKNGVHIGAQSVVTVVLK